MTDGLVKFSVPELFCEETGGFVAGGKRLAMLSSYRLLERLIIVGHCPRAASVILTVHYVFSVFYEQGVE